MNKTKMFALGGKNKKGSILAYSLIVIVTLVSIAAMIAITTTIERKNASATQFSVQALQTADSGLQVGIKGIYEANNGGDPISSVAFATDPASSCQPAGSGPDFVTGTITEGGISSTYVFSFYDINDVPLDCSSDIEDVAKIKSIGTYRDTVRAVESEVERNLIPENADVVFVLDRSESISNTEIDQERIAISALIDELFQPGSNYQLGIIDYNHEIIKTDSLKNSAQRADLDNFLLQDHRGADTYTGPAIESAADMLSGGRGAGFPKVIILITDGVPHCEGVSPPPPGYNCTRDFNTTECYPSIYWDNQQSQIAIDKAGDARAAGITIITVGIGLGDLETTACETAARDLMRDDISSEQEYYFPIDDFDELDEVLDSLG